MTSAQPPFSGSGKLCTNLGATPPPPPPPCPIGVVPGVPPVPQFSGGGTFKPLIGPYSVPFFEVTGNFYAVADPSVSGTINTPQVQPVDALVSFTPRLPAGFQAFVSDYLISAAYNAVQVVSMIGNPIEGTWELMFGTQQTSTMAFNISPAGLQSALAALPGIGAGNVAVTAGINPQSYNVQFTGTLAATAILPLVPSWQDLIDANGYDCEITVATTALGSPQITGPTSISIPARQARIFSGVLSTIDYVDTPGVNLTSNAPFLNIPVAYQPLVYDVAFSAVTFNNASQVLGNFAFIAPTDNTPVCITDPKTMKLDYAKPNTTGWVPVPSAAGLTGPAPTVTAISDWRGRARRTA